MAGACGYFIYSKLEDADGLAFGEIIGLPGLPVVLCFALLLTPLNWYLEALKWRLCLKPVVRLEKNEALNAVLRGLSLNWVLPFSIGDFVGRILEIEKSAQSVKSIILNKYVSLSVTIVLGSIGSFWYFDLVLFIPVLVMLSGIVIMIATPRLFNRYANRHLLSLYLLTAIRYVVFTSQFIFIASLVVPDVPISAWILGTPVVLAIKSVVPSFLGGIGLREAATIAVFGLYTDNLGALTVASLLIWMINIVIPSIYGLIPIISYKMKFQG